MTHTESKDDDGNCVGIQTEDDDFVVYDRGNPSSAWIKTERSYRVEQ